MCVAAALIAGAAGRSTRRGAEKRRRSDRPVMVTAQEPATFAARRSGVVGRVNDAALDAHSAALAPAHR
jgi:hypothetical protein